MYFVAAPVQMILVRYVFDVANMQSRGSILWLVVTTVLLWIATFLASLAIVYVVKSVMKKFSKGREVS